MVTEQLSNFDIIAGTCGGVGLFLLGMHLLTDGLKLAAGRALEGLLERWTSTPLRGLAAGMLITTLVQSSSAVTVASIGFVNAGLLSLKHSLWVIFGSNVGTTMNAWLVAALGFNFKIDAFALPIIGIGAVLMLAGRGARPRSLGQALAGFGVLFLGIQVLKDTFSGFGQGMQIEQYISPGVSGYLVLVGLGTLLTILMQASGAAIAIVITAAQGGLMSIEAACAMVIGTNIGTTSTAVLSALGATSNARRLAAAHVFFNLVTGAVALALLPGLIALLAVIREWIDQPATPAIMIALFHTVFNLLGVLLMVPASPWLLRLLAGHFKRGDEDLGRPRFLDSSATSVPDLALRALRMELGRTQAISCESLAQAVAVPPAGAAIEAHRSTLMSLADAIGEYSQKLSSVRLPVTLVDQLAECLRVLQYQENAVEACRQSAASSAALSPLPGPGLLEAARAFHGSVRQLAAAADHDHPEFDRAQVEWLLGKTETDYAHFKERLLAAGADGSLGVRRMQEHLQQASQLRRAAEQCAKAADHMSALDRGIEPPSEKHGERLAA